MIRLLFLVAALAVFGGCAQSSPVESGLADVLVGRVVDQFDNQPRAGIIVRFRGGEAVTDAQGRFAVTGPRSGRKLEFNAPSILPRRTYAWDGDSIWKVVPAGFDTAAYHDLARSYAAGTIRWTKKPLIYIDTRRHCFTGGDPLLWASQSKTQTQEFVTAWTAGRVKPSVVVTNAPPSDLTAGTIVVHFSECSSDVGQFIGLARVSWDNSGRILAATIHARFRKYANDSGKRKGILGHELGHTLGYRHMFAGVPSLMEASLGSKTALKPFDLLAARFLYGRVPLNTAPDDDSRTRIGLKLAGSGYWEGE